MELREHLLYGGYPPTVGADARHRPARERSDHDEKEAYYLRGNIGPHRPLPPKQAKEYLQGRSPGVMRSYAPDAHADDKDGFVESEDTVHRLAHWREDAIY